MNLGDYMPPQSLIQSALDNTFTMQELVDTLKGMKEKAPGMDGIGMEAYKYSGAELQNVTLLNSYNDILRTGNIDAVTRDLLLVIIFKSGDRHICDNYRGIALINAHGKILERLIYRRLMPFAKSIPNCIPAAQFGFMPDCGTADAQFISGQVSVDAFRMNTNIFKLFIDFSKAYDRVNRAALWRVLERRGVPPRCSSPSRIYTRRPWHI